MNGRARAWWRRGWGTRDGGWVVDDVHAGGVGKRDGREGWTTEDGRAGGGRDRAKARAKTTRDGTSCAVVRARSRALEEGLRWCEAMRGGVKVIWAWMCVNLDRLGD